METLTTSAAATTAGRITVQDSTVAAAWNLTDWQWSVLTDTERADLRSRVAYAPNFKA